MMNDNVRKTMGEKNEVHENYDYILKNIELYSKDYEKEKYEDNKNFDPYLTLLRSDDEEEGEDGDLDENGDKEEKPLDLEDEISELVGNQLNQKENEEKERKLEKMHKKYENKLSVQDKLDFLEVELGEYKKRDTLQKSVIQNLKMSKKNETKKLNTSINQLKVTNKKLSDKLQEVSQGKKQYLDKITHLNRNLTEKSKIIFQNEKEMRETIKKRQQEKIFYDDLWGRIAGVQKKMFKMFQIYGSSVMKIGNDDKNETSLLETPDVFRAGIITNKNLKIDESDEEMRASLDKRLIKSGVKEKELNPKKISFNPREILKENQILKLYNKKLIVSVEKIKEQNDNLKKTLIEIKNYHFKSLAKRKSVGTATEKEKKIDMNLMKDLYEKVDQSSKLLEQQRGIITRINFENENGKRKNQLSKKIMFEFVKMFDDIQKKLKESLPEEDDVDTSNEEEEEEMEVLKEKIQDEKLEEVLNFFPRKSEYFLKKFSVLKETNEKEDLISELEKVKVSEWGGEEFEFWKDLVYIGDYFVPNEEITVEIIKNMRYEYNIEDSKLLTLQFNIHLMYLKKLIKENGCMDVKFLDFINSYFELYEIIGGTQLGGEVMLNIEDFERMEALFQKYNDPLRTRDIDDEDEGEEEENEV